MAMPRVDAECILKLREQLGGLNHDVFDIVFASISMAAESRVEEYWVRREQIMAHVLFPTKQSKDAAFFSFGSTPDEEDLLPQDEHQPIVPSKKKETNLVIRNGCSKEDRSRIKKLQEMEEAANGLDGKFESSKRKMVEEYNAIRDSRKKIKMMDVVKTLPKPKQPIRTRFGANHFRGRRK